MTPRIAARAIRFSRRSAPKRGVRRKNRRKRFARIVVGAPLVILLVLVVTGFTGAAVWMTSCDLNSLKPVDVGENSFVYAADGSLLGSIPAEKNRQPVDARAHEQLGPAGDGRDRGPPLLAARRARLRRHRACAVRERSGRPCRAGRVDDHTAARAQPLHQEAVADVRPQGDRGVPRDQARAGEVEALDPERVRQPGLLRQPRLRDRGRGADVLLEARDAPDLAPGCAARGSAAAAVGVRSVPPSAGGDPAARRGAAGDALDGYITATQYADAVADRRLHLKPGRLYTTIREPYFFSYVLDAAAEAVRLEHRADRRAAGSTRRSIRACNGSRSRRSATRCRTRRDPAAAIVSINPTNGAIRAMTEFSPGNPKNQVNFASSARRQPGSTFKTMVLTTAIAQGISPSTTYLSAPFKYDPTGDGLVRRRSADGVVSGDVRPLLRRRDVDRERNAALRQHRVRAADARRRPGERRDDGAHARRQDAARRQRCLRPVDGPRLAGRHAASISPPRTRRSRPAASTRSRWRSERSSSPAARSTREAGWGVPQRTRVIPDWVAAEVTRILEENMTSGTGTGAYFGKTSAGKTGTTDNYADAWFCGFTPRLEASSGSATPEVRSRCCPCTASPSPARRSRRRSGGCSWRRRSSTRPAGSSSRRRSTSRTGSRTRCSTR